jgi:hypothetical protein
VAISTATFLIFIFILPGFVFLVGIHSRSRLRIPGLQNNLLWDISFFLAASFLVNIMSLELYFDNFLLPYLQLHFDPNDLLFKTPQNNTLSYTAFLYNEKGYVFIFIVINVLVAYLLGRLFIVLNNYRIIKSEFHYGPFYNLISGRFPIVTTAILTRVSHDGKVLMYSGYLDDIIFASDRTIDYIILAYPIQRYFMDMSVTPPTTTDGIDLELPPGRVSGSFLINGSDIENIFFIRQQPNTWREVLRGFVYATLSSIAGLLSRWRVWIVVLLACLVGVVVLGRPNVLVSRRCGTSQGGCLSYQSCDYVGLGGWRHFIPNGENCPWVKMFPVSLPHLPSQKP